MRVHTHNDAINAYVFVNTTPFTKENIIVIMRHNKCYSTRQCFDAVGWAAGRASGL